MRGLELVRDCDLGWDCNEEDQGRLCTEPYCLAQLLGTGCDPDTDPEPTADAERERPALLADV